MYKLKFPMHMVAVLNAENSINDASDLVTFKFVVAIAVFSLVDATYIYPCFLALSLLSCLPSFRGAPRLAYSVFTYLFYLCDKRHSDCLDTVTIFV